MQTDIFVTVRHTKPLFKLAQKFDKGYSYEIWKNPRVFTSANRQAVAAIMSAILVIVRRTKPIFELGREFDGSTPYMKLWKKSGDK